MSAADLWAMQIPEGEDELLLRWTDDIQFLPIVRNATMQNGVTKEPLSKATFSKIVKSVLNLSGFLRVPQSIAYLFFSSKTPHLEAKFDRPVYLKVGLKDRPTRRS